MRLLLISPWSASDVLTCAYVVPYIPLIKNALLKLGFTAQIHLITVEREPVRDSKSIALDFGCELHYPLIFSGPSPFGYLRLAFSLSKAVFLAFSYRYRFIQSWCATGGSIGLILSVLSSTPLLLDSFEPHADAMDETSCWSRFGFKFNLLRTLEILQAKVAKAFFPVSRHMYAYSKFSYNVSIQGRSVIKPACVRIPPIHSTQIVSNYPRIVRGIYVGKFGGLYLDVEFFRILKLAHSFWGSRLQFTILSCQDISVIREFAHQANFDISSINIKCVPHSEVPRFLSSADFAISTLKPVPSRLCCTPVKNGEYWAWGLPVLSTSGISIDSEIISSMNIGVVLQDFTEAHILSSLSVLDNIIQLNTDGSVSELIRSIASKYRAFIWLKMHIYPFMQNFSLFPLIRT